MITLAFSPCPNDTFVFDAIIHKRIDLEGLTFDCRLHDVETLNQMALAGGMDMMKVSFFTYLMIQRNIVLLDSGSALGFGVGPLLISKEKYTQQFMGNVVKGYFDNSYKKVVSFFTGNENLSVNEMEEIRRIIDEQIAQRKALQNE